MNLRNYKIYAQSMCAVALCIFFAAAMPAYAEESTEHHIKAPVADKIKKELTIHSDTRIDYYYWLNERDNPEVIKYLTAENEYTTAMLKDTEPLQKKLYDEIVGRIKQTDMEVPYLENGYYYYKRFEKGKEYPIYCRKKGSLKAREEIILNVNKMAQGYDYYNVSDVYVSPNNTILAYGVDTVSRRKYTIYFKNLTTGKLLKDALVNTSGNTAWANDNKTVFYEIKDEVTLRPFKIYRHVLGTDQSTDKLVFHEKDEAYNIMVFKTRSQKYLIIAADSTLSTEYRFLDASTPDKEFIIFQPREKELEYHIDHVNDTFYIRTNLNAKNFRLMKTSVTSTGKDNWIEVVPHRDDVLLDGFELFNNFIVLDEMKDGLKQFRVMDLAKDMDYYIDFGEETYMAYFDENRVMDTNVLRFVYSSLTTPESTYDYDMSMHKKILLKREEVTRRI